jgi:23S rRNA (guanine2535-N1)-methyltransferase
MSKYKFETAREDYCHYASGNVFTSVPGATGFPVRLASEIFQTCFALRPIKAQKDRVVLYDPCCGIAHMLATIAYRHWARIKAIIGSDFDDRVLQVARRNLSMLTRLGLITKLEYLHEAQRLDPRTSRDNTLQSVQFFLDRLSMLEATNSIDYSLFRADVGCVQEVISGMRSRPADIVITDIPYAGLSHWKGTLARAQSRSAALDSLLGSIRPVLAADGVVAIVSPKSDEVSHPAFRRLRKLKLGKRSVTFLAPLLSEKEFNAGSNVLVPSAP